MALLARPQQRANPAQGAPTAGSVSRTAFTMQVGLALLALLTIELATGLLFYVARAQLPTGLSAATLTAVHIYVGLVSIPLLAVKLWVSVPLLRAYPTTGAARASYAAAWVGGWALRSRTRALGSNPRSPGTPHATAFQRSNSALLVALSLAMYASGLVLYLLPSLPKWWLIQIHLWSSLLAVAPTSIHLTRHARPSWRAFRQRATRLRAAVTNPDHVRARPALEPPAKLVSRRAAIGLLVTAWAALAIHRLASALEPLGGDDPNDFPVTLVTEGYKVPDPAAWQIKIFGNVERPTTVRFADLAAMPRVAHRYPLDCISGWSVEREWGGVPLGHVLALAGPKAPNSRVLLRSATGYEQVTTLEGAARPEAMLCTHVDGVPLSDEHGAPVRFMTKGVIGEVNVKWLAEIEVKA